MAFKRWKKSPSKRPPRKLWPKDEMKVIGWCLQNKISIGISPDWNHSLHYWQIDIKVRNSRWHTDPSRYDDDVVLNKLYQYYKYYYDKHNK